MLRALSGHLWTVGPFLADLVRPPREAAAHGWQTALDDPQVGPVRLTGRLHAPAGARTLLVVVHGLGGSVASSYMIRAAQAAAADGLATLRLNLRGAPRDGEDIHHAGLTADLVAALASPELARFEHVVLLGYSLGAHLVLRYASEEPDSRVRALAAVCAPVDLDRSAEEIDRASRTPYRRHLLRALVEIYASVHRRRSGPLTVPEARRIRTLREWDARVVAPRFGFASAEDYYGRASVAPRLGRIARPTLVVQAARDPMVLARTARPSLERASSSIDVRWLPRGGHVAFPRDVSLGLPGPPGLEPQLVRWLASR